MKRVLFAVAALLVLAGSALGVQWNKSSYQNLVNDTGISQLADGTLDQPAYSFQSNTHSGLYYNSGTGNIEIVKNGVSQGPLAGLTGGTSTITTCGNGRVLFDDNGVLGCDADLTWNKTTNVASVASAVAFGAIPSLNGAVRLSFGNKITFRNTANSGDIDFFSTSGSNVIEIGDASGVIRLNRSSLAIGGDGTGANELTYVEGTGWTWEGSSADANETIITVADPTADVTYSFPAVAAGTYQVAGALTTTAVIDFANQAIAGSEDSANITVTGAATGDTCVVGIPVAAANDVDSAFTCYVSAADTVKVRHNAVAAADPGSGTFRVSVYKF